MNSTDASPRRPCGDAKLPWWDWLALPATGLLTICLISAFTELIARHAFSDTIGSRPSCTVRNDNPAGARTVPNTVCWEKLSEGELTQYRFNSCGDRAEMECGRKPAGVYRIVVTGTSLAVGRYLPREKTIAALLPVDLSQLTGHKVEVYNESMMQGFLDSMPLRFDEILADRPDLILWIVSTRDIGVPSYVPYHAPTLNLPDSAGKPLSLKRAWYLLKNAYSTGSIQDVFRNHFDRTRTSLMLQHLLYQSQTLYVKSVLMQSDGEAGFLKSQPSAQWSDHLHHLDSEAAVLSEKSKAAGIPIAFALAPNRAQAALISMGVWPPGVDPFMLDNELRPIIERHGGIYIDILPDFRSIPNPEKAFFPVDGHPNADGNAMIARLLAKKLTTGSVRALDPNFQQQAAIIRATSR